MKSLSGFAIAAAIAVAVTGTAPAQDVAKPVPVVPAFNAEVVKVIGADRIVVVKTVDGKEVRLKILPDARIVVNRKVVALDDLAEGVPVRVAYTDREGVFQVSSLESPIVVVPVKPAASEPPVVVPAAVVVGGNMAGLVMEGDRPQPNLPVTLRTQEGKVVATTRTTLEGAFAFKNVAPGTYVTYTEKADSQTKSESLVTIKSGQTLNNVVLNLVRPPLR